MTAVGIEAGVHTFWPLPAASSRSERPLLGGRAGAIDRGCVKPGHQLRPRGPDTLARPRASILTRFQSLPFRVLAVRWHFQTASTFAVTSCRCVDGLA